MDYTFNCLTFKQCIFYSCQVQFYMHYLVFPIFLFYFVASIASRITWTSSR